MKKWLLVLIPAALVAATLMPISTVLCACVSPGDQILVLTGANPMKVSPDKARSAFLNKIPFGTPESRVREKLTDYLFNGHCHPAKTHMGHECRFEELAVNSIFGSYREGFQIDLHIDSQGELRDVHFTKFRIDR